MRFVKPAVFMTFKSMPIDDEIYRWLKHIGCSGEVAKKYAYERNKTSAERGVELFGRRCYMSFEPGLNPNVTKIREEVRDYIDNIMKSKHGSVLEHITFTFCIEGVSRVFTGEMNRHRAGVAISEGSMRYIRYNDIPIVDVSSIQYSENEELDLDLLEREDIPEGSKPFAEAVQTKRITRTLIRKIVEEIEGVYSELVAIWAEILEGKEFVGKKHITSMLRRIIPMGVATGGVWTFNIRALRHMLTMRASEAAEEEICEVAVMILNRMIKEEPILFGDFKQDERGYWKPTYEKV